jgi:hypothetical protein
VELLPNVKTVYKIINSTTGSIGGNADGGAIYGETTAYSLQKIINLMKMHTGFNSESRFIDIGSGLGKPNMHVAQDPGVQFSCGVEIKRLRWMLCIHNFNKVLRYSVQQSISGATESSKLLGFNCFFLNNDIAEANTLDPFTHVYMFDIGFPPALMETLSHIFNRSCSFYLICYHPPTIIINHYDFHVVLLCQHNTTMHGSGENHTGYIYERSYKPDNHSPDIRTDPMFTDSWNLVKSGFNNLYDIVHNTLELELNAPRSMRR